MSTNDSSTEFLNRALGASSSESADLIAENLASDSPFAEPIVACLLEGQQGHRIIDELPLGSLGELVDLVISELDSSSPPTAEAKALTWQTLDLIRQRQVLRKINQSGEFDSWIERTLQLIDGSNFSFGALLEQRCSTYGSRPLFILPANKGYRSVSWRQVASRVEVIARGLINLLGDEEKRIAILSPNRLETALVDFACLTTGIVNVMIPATSTDNDVRYILEHSGASTVVASTKEQVAQVLRVRHEVPHLERVIQVGGRIKKDPLVISFDSLLDGANSVPAQVVHERRDRIDLSQLATLMYTSGTTGMPKGIRFSQRNIVFKRFARAMALPEIGDDDRFLAYLPLFHTFGRYLELTGCVFWGATYCFAESPDIQTLRRHMTELAPTVMISIPMKWIQLYDQIRELVAIETASAEEVDRAVRKVVGPSLRWGLSAAGYLDPEIFVFFQQNGVELMSGFGMTEATGGITMTPPGEYIEDSLGDALPGIEVSLAEDGELLVRGPYVMLGYHEPPDGSPSFDADGWFHTGDLMEVDSNGYLRIIDRKKEIYKNVKGQTVAPQKIENQFRDFDSVARIFLVGDHRPYNTALIYPDRDFPELDLGSLSEEDLKTHFRSLVVTANSFLAPFERIVDFAVIDRDFDAELGELTPKGTYRRKTIERNFSDQIRLLYRRTTLRIGDADVTVPNWLFQSLGITTQNLKVVDGALSLEEHPERLPIRRLSDNEVLIGSAVYDVTNEPVDLGTLLSTPRLWLGNDQLILFAQLEPSTQGRRRRRAPDLRWLRRYSPYVPSEAERERAVALVRKTDIELSDLHLCALLMEADTEDASLAVRTLEHVLELEEGPNVESSRRVLRRAATVANPTVSQRAFEVLSSTESDAIFPRTLSDFLKARPTLLDPETTAVLIDRKLTNERLDAFINESDKHCQLAATTETDTDTAADLLRFLARYGASHPSQFRPIRTFLTRMAMTARYSSTRSTAETAGIELLLGFRTWLGSPSAVAVDPETGFEYRWAEVIAFDDDVPDDDRRRILAAIKTTSLLHEGVFLFSGGTVVRLSDILPGGVWIRRLGLAHGRAVYRIAIKTRHRGTFDIALNLVHDMTPDEIDEETGWLVVCGETGSDPALAEDFGGSWPDHALWTEEFIPGQTLNQALRRLSRQSDEDRFKGLWPFAAWSALGTYVEFWNRSGRRLIIENPDPANVIVPTHDYHTGARLVSIACRVPFESVAAMLIGFRDRFVKRVEDEHPRLQGVVAWDLILSSLLEVVGETEGIELLDQAAQDSDTPPELVAAIGEYLGAVRRRGFLPRRLYFAGQRLRRWQELNPDATRQARAHTLQELYETYRIEQMLSTYPEARARFFQESVFRSAPEQLRQALAGIIDRLRTREISQDELATAVAEVRAHLSPDTEEDFFLARLSFPHLRPEDEARYIATASGGSQQSEMVVTLTDVDGDVFRIRHALRPKEIGRLHGLFLAAKLQVQLLPEHRFLIAVNERGHLIGGLLYESNPDDLTAHLDKIVVAEAFRRKGVAGDLLEELCNRLRAAGLRTLTTGFFRPQFFYRYGFTVERRYAGLVRQLGEDSEETPPSKAGSI